MAGTRGHTTPLRRESLASQVEEILRRRFETGELQPGDRLPGEHDLASEIGVSRATVRTAVDSLARQGLVVKRHGVGNFVGEGTLLRNNLAEAEDFNVLMARQGFEPEVVFDSVQRLTAEPDLARALGLPEGAEVVRIAKRFRVENSTVVMALWSMAVEILGPDLTERILADPALTEPLFDFLETELRLTTAYQLADIGAELSDRISYPHPEPGPVTAVMRFDETGYSPTNRPLWHSRNWFPPGEMSFGLIRCRPPSRPLPLENR
ncbi:MAG TPA: GntR family transcriptional regulator [Acidimicrobiales bacterium]|nr:GntR family transcriptional regulator [Acidimicrobiales bacterium]